MFELVSRGQLKPGACELRSVRRRQIVAPARRRQISRRYGLSLSVHSVSYWWRRTQVWWQVKRSDAQGAAWWGRTIAATQSSRNLPKESKAWVRTKVVPAPKHHAMKAYAGHISTVPCILNLFHGQSNECHWMSHNVFLTRPSNWSFNFRFPFATE
jgi:hypothetical protein